MKQHKIELDMVAKKMPNLAAKLPIMYDAAKDKLLGTETKSIGHVATFNFSVDCAEIGQAKLSRAIEAESGVYVKLIKFKDADLLLEVGQILAIENLTNGQTNCKAW